MGLQVRMPAFWAAIDKAGSALVSLGACAHEASAQDVAATNSKVLSGTLRVMWLVSMKKAQPLAGLGHHSNLLRAYQEKPTPTPAAVLAALPPETVPRMMVMGLMR